MTIPKKIIVLVIDTLRADHLGCYGYARGTSPNIDGLAGESILFSHAFTPVSYTLPAIASLMTSRMPESASTMVPNDTSMPPVPIWAEKPRLPTDSSKRPSP